VLDDRPHLGGARRAQDGGERRALANMIDGDRREAALVVMRVSRTQGPGRHAPTRACRR
jgi:hypothetical protein